MSLATRYFLIVLPGNIRVFKDSKTQNSKMHDVVRSMTQDAVAAANFTTSRKDPQTINVKVFEQTIKNGAIVDSPYCEFDIMPPKKRMTSEDYIIEHAIIVRDLSSEFLELVEEQMRRGKCYEEKIDIARDFTKSLSNALARYNKKISAHFPLNT